jgi:hypothetical protein
MLSTRSTSYILSLFCISHLYKLSCDSLTTVVDVGGLRATLAGASKSGSIFLIWVLLPFFLAQLYFVLSLQQQHHIWAPKIIQVDNDKWDMSSFSLPFFFLSVVYLSSTIISLLSLRARGRWEDQEELRAGRSCAEQGPCPGEFPPDRATPGRNSTGQGWRRGGAHASSSGAGADHEGEARRR